MGNQPSVSEEVASILSPKAKKKLQFLQTSKDTGNKPSSAPLSMPSLRETWHETSRPAHRTAAAVIKQPLQIPTPLTIHTAGNDVVHSPVTSKKTVVTEHRPLGNPRASCYVVSTTTYYVQSPVIPELISSSSTSNNESRANEKNTNKSAMIYMTINKRKFVCIPGMQYRFTCDDDESDRLIIQHFLLKHAFHGNFIAPIQDILVNGQLCTKESPRPQVLDVGCGPGTWVLEMATDFSNTDFHGIDACTTFPDTIKPSNVYFRQHNILCGLPYDDATFDYVHVRLLLSNMTHVQALRLVAEVTRVLKPSGYVELCDVQHRVQRPGPVSDALVNQKLYDVYESSYQINLDSSQYLSRILVMPETNSSSLSGYIDVCQEQATIPLGWGGQLGQLHGQNFQAFLSSLDPQVKEKAELTDQGIDQIVQECEKHQSYLHWFACYGQKPGKRDTILPSSPISPMEPEEQQKLPSSYIEESAWEAIAKFSDGYVD